MFSKQERYLGESKKFSSSFKNIFYCYFCCSQVLGSHNTHRQMGLGENSSHMGNLELSCSYCSPGIKEVHFSTCGATL